MFFNSPFSFRAAFKPPPSFRTSGAQYTAPHVQPLLPSSTSPQSTAQQHELPVDLNLMSPPTEEAMFSTSQPMHLPQAYGRSSVNQNAVQTVPSSTAFYPGFQFRADVLRSPLVTPPNGFVDARISQVNSHLLNVEDSPSDDFVPATQLADEGPPSSAVEESTTNASTKQGRKGGRKATDKTSSKTKKAPTGRFFWAQVTLLECKKHYDDKRCAADLYQKIKTNEEQWIDIIEICVSRGLVVDWQQAYEKYKRLSISYREISDWERNTPSGKDYWTMTPAERVAVGRFTHCNFPIDVYELMDRLFGMDKAVNPSASVVDTSNGKAIPATCRSSTTSPQVHEPTTDQSPSFDKTQTNGGVEKKSWKRTHTFDVGLVEATKDLMRGWELAEDGKKQRHETTMEVQHSQHEELVTLEREKLQISLLFASSVQGMASALGKMADKL
ncbi:hypothetical protein L7F22_041726 [Adiantum nelumboides]|nr:hypothetical protein [Adiantum nelumboides]